MEKKSKRWLYEFRIFSLRFIDKTSLGLTGYLQASLFFIYISLENVANLLHMRSKKLA